MKSLLDKVTKYQTIATEGKITDEICNVAWSVPLPVKQAIDAQIATVLSLSYRFRDLHYGGPGPSDEVREQTRKEYEKLVIAFATRLQAFRINSYHDDP